MLSASNPTGVLVLDKKDRYLYHYTSIETALSHILPQGALRLGPFTKTNDPRESKDWKFVFVSYKNAFAEVSEEERARLAREAAQLAKNTCKVLCLTEDDERAVGGGIDSIYWRGFCRPRMWAQYADKHRGICLIFDRAQLRESIMTSLEASSVLFERSVEYHNRSSAPPPSKGPFFLNLDSMRSDGPERTIRKHISEYWRELFFEKALDWQDEKEFRWVVWDLTHSEHFVNFGSALRGIVVGPEFDDRLLPGLGDYVARYDLYLCRLDWNNGVPQGPFPRRASTPSPPSMWMTIADEWPQYHPLRKWNPHWHLNRAADLGLTVERYLELAAGGHPTPEEMKAITERTNITEHQWIEWEKSKPRPGAEPSKPK
ncbi:MAG TPA: DUF2971 domain-containing protein [bacterium]|nr:DUF2971 domain-containing protein [bacterium]